MIGASTAVVVLMCACIMAQVLAHRTSQDEARLPYSFAVTILGTLHYSGRRASTPPVPRGWFPGLAACFGPLLDGVPSYCRAVFLAGKRIGARFRVPRGFLARRSRSVEGRNPVSTLGGMGQSRIWRTPVHLLSAAVVAAGSLVEFRRALELRAGCLPRAGRDLRGMFCVPVLPPHAAGTRRAVRRRLLCGESECFADHLHAQ